MQKKRKIMMTRTDHPEILSGLKEIVRINKSYKKYVHSLGSAATEERRKLSPDAFYKKVLKFNTENGGTLAADIQRVTVQLGDAQPEFNPITGISMHHIQDYVNTITVPCHRMRNQLILMKILEVKSLFKSEQDIFKPQNITRIENLLKDLK